MVCFLLGSIPFGFLLVKAFKRADVRENGTGNIGATNTMLVGGKILGVITLFLDLAKGATAVILARLYGGGELGLLVCGLVVVAGHDFSVFLKFKGGKGVATTVGAVFMIDPVLTVICLFSYILVLLVTRYIIISTLIVMAFLPLLMWLANYDFGYILFGFLIFLLALFAHREDLLRFFSGREVKINKALGRFSAG
jgi:glycerol-3-phosphate acyltransferase PlsY